MKSIISSILFLISTTCAAAEYSVNLGAAHTDADTSRGRVDAKTNARFGLGIDLGLGGPWTFTTGTDYVFRRLTWHRDDGARLAVDFDYIDVPAAVRVRLCPIASVSAGLRFGINVSDKVEVQTGVNPFDARARAIITLWDVGLRFDLPRHFAIGAFYEREMDGGFARSLGALQATGGRVDYSF